MSERAATSGIRQWAKARVPAIARRDAKLEQQRKRIAQLERELEAARVAGDTARRRVEALERAQTAARRPSFRRKVLEMRRRPEFAHAVDRDRWLPHLQIQFKLRNYRLAASHGIDVPTVYGSWSVLDEVDLGSLPDAFVLKSDGGASAEGVFPLNRVGPNRYEWLANGTVLRAEEIIESMRSRGGRARPPYFAEELLRGEAAGLLPHDVKIYSFYGEVGHVLLRRVEAHDGDARVFSKYIDSQGRGLDLPITDREIDSDIPNPAALPTMVGIARHLSRAVGLPFCRVDLYGVDNRVVLGEITLVPGGKQQYGPEHDEYLGRLYAEARERLELDIMLGRPPGVLHGEVPAVNLYPAGHRSHHEDPGSWGVRSAPCSKWCSSTKR